MKQTVQKSAPKKLVEKLRQVYSIIKYIWSKPVSVGDIVLLLQLKFLVTEITPMGVLGYRVMMLICLE